MVANHINGFLGKFLKCHHILIINESMPDILRRSVRLNPQLLLPIVGVTESLRRSNRLNPQLLRIANLQELFITFTWRNSEFDWFEILLSVLFIFCFNSILMSLTQVLLVKAICVSCGVMDSVETWLDLTVQFSIVLVSSGGSVCLFGSVFIG